MLKLSDKEREVVRAYIRECSKSQGKSESGQLSNSRPFSLSRWRGEALKQKAGVTPLFAMEYILWGDWNDWVRSKAPNLLNLWQNVDYGRDQILATKVLREMLSESSPSLNLEDYA